MIRVSSFAQPLRGITASTGLSLVLGTTAFAQNSPNPNDIVLDQLVVTGTGRAEPRSQIPGTVLVLDQKIIERSSAQSITGLLAENGVGFFSEWTPGQTSINMRGGSSDGQGKDFRGQIMVLMNGRRAGTANLSKLSLADVERIEIVKGPSSVVYGSQNIGGVINIILKTGLTSPGGRLRATTGSWALGQGLAQIGGVKDKVDYFFSVNGGIRDDYHSGRGGSRMDNTSWKRFGAGGAVGYQFNENNRIETTIRTDGVYDVGFRGSGANVFSTDDRYNSSVDMTYNGQSTDGTYRWMMQGYVVQDVDDFNWASPVIRGSNGQPARGTLSDHNKRKLDIVGTRIQPSMTPWTGNTLMGGWDWEYSRLRSDRFRIGVPGNLLKQVAPQDNNQTETVNAFYLEDAQKFLDDRLTVRGGLRQTFGTTSFDLTPNLANQVPRSVNYDTTTYSAGLTYRANERLNLRLGYSTGFRAPTATELGADFNTLGGGRIFGNPDLKPETSQQFEVGAFVLGDGWWLDLALFQNTIANRIITRARKGVPNTSDYVNNPDDIVVRGLELQFDADLLEVGGYVSETWRWSLFANGAYNFDMEDLGAASTANTNMPQRMYEYQGAIGTRFGQRNIAYPWSIEVTGILRGPMWYDTEENLLIPLAEPDRTWIHRKGAFWVWNIRGEVEVMKDVKLFGFVNNLFNINEHPIFIGLDKAPYLLNPQLANGGIGTSMPGTELQVGLEMRF